MKVLSIGNSFSQDAHRYLHKLAKLEGVDIQTTNLYVGGCTLERHYFNVINDVKEYVLEINGEITSELVSIHKTLTSEKWDFVTLQQASYHSGNYATYVPYIYEIATYVKTHCPNAKILIHETWAYEDGSDRLRDFTNYKTADEMFCSLKQSYQNALTDVNAYGLIPCGTVFMHAVKDYSVPVHRDTLHASFGLGRYMLALTWYKFLTGNSITNNSFNDFDEPVTETERQVAISCVNKVLPN